MAQTGSRWGIAWTPLSETAPAVRYPPPPHLLDKGGEHLCCPADSQASNLAFEVLLDVGSWYSRRDRFHFLLSTGPLVHWSTGPLVHWSTGPLVCTSFDPFLTAFASAASSALGFMSLPVIVLEAGQTGQKWTNFVSPKPQRADSLLGVCVQPSW